MKNTKKTPAKKTNADTIFLISIVESEGDYNNGYSPTKTSKPVVYCKSANDAATWIRSSKNMSMKIMGYTPDFIVTPMTMAEVPWAF